MSTLIIKTNVSQVTDILIRDMGTLVPNSGGNITITILTDLDNARLSQDLITLATDNAYGVNNSTLILNNGTVDISQAQVASFLAQVSGIQGDTGISGITGLLGLTGFQGLTGLQGQTGLQGITGIGNTGFQGYTGLSGLTGIQGITGLGGAAGADGADGVQGITGIGIITPYYEATATGTTTTTSGSPGAVAASMTLSPEAGTYAVWFTTSVQHSSSSATITCSIYSGTVGSLSQNTSSIRIWQKASSNQPASVACTARVTITAGQVIQGWWYTSSSTATMNQRSLLIIKVA